MSSHGGRLRDYLDDLTIGPGKIKGTKFWGSALAPPQNDEEKTTWSNQLGSFASWRDELDRAVQKERPGRDLIVPNRQAVERASRDPLQVLVNKERFDTLERAEIPSGLKGHKVWLLKNRKLDSEGKPTEDLIIEEENAKAWIKVREKAHKAKDSNTKLLQETLQTIQTGEGGATQENLHKLFWASEYKLRELSHTGFTGEPIECAIPPE